MAEKRPHSPVPGEDGHVEDVRGEGDGGAIVLSKKQRTDGGEIVVGSVTKDGVKRTSNLLAPTMQLTGHSGEVYGSAFSPDGKSIASGSFDKQVFLWRVFGECDNYLVFKGHKNAVLQVQWLPSGEHVVSCSADRTVRGWDVETGLQIKKYKEHDAIVNGVGVLRRGPPLIVSASDDCSAKVWDMRSKRSTSTLKDPFQVTCCSFSDAGDQVYTAGLDNAVKVWDLRKNSVSLTLRAHSDTVTGLSLSPDGHHLLTNAMDNTLRMWDMRPYAPANRCIRVMTGHLHSFEKLLLRCSWSADGSKVSCGSADRMVYVWESLSCRLLYKLPGHNGSVNDVGFHPHEPIISSASSDKTLFLGELIE